MIVAGLGVLVGAVAIKLARKRRESFRGRVVIITGGSRGLGLVLARLFAQEGAKLLLVARSAEDLELSAGDLRHMGADVHFLCGDVGKKETAQKVVDAALAAFGRLDVLVNCAGIILVGPLATMREADFHESMDTHLWGPYRLMQAALPKLRATRGRVVNIISIGGKIAVPHLSSYSASKFALAGLSDAFRAEVAESGVSVTSVFPGLLRTGSHVRAMFKGDVAKEFGWFALGSATPLTSISAERAGRKIVAACRKRTPRLVISVQAKAAVLGEALFPGIAARVATLVNAWLPHGTHVLEPVEGSQARGTFPPRFVTTLADRASVRNHEIK